MFRRRILPAALLVAALTLPAASGAATADIPFDSALQHDVAFAGQRLTATTATLPATSYPVATNAAGDWTTTSASSWTSGFLPGSLWLLYQQTGSSTWRTKAVTSQTGVESQKNNTSTHDVGFIIFSSFGNAYRLTGNDAYRQVVLKAAASLATRYNPTVGALKSWNGASTDFTVIIDNMMNLELLFWASTHGGQQAWYDMAVSHALRTSQQHVRPDGSTYHVVNYNPTTGAVKFRGTNQGYSDSSTWSRGQAWAIHGFTTAYRETGDARFLATARKVSDWYLAHLPSDSIPYWDFNAPGIPNEPKDTSAASIAASGLIELSRLEPDATRKATYLDAARSMLTSLSSPAYLAEGTSNDAILLHGTQNKPVGKFDTGLIFGDYYFLEAIERYRSVVPTDPPLAVSAVTASADDGNRPANTLDGNAATRWSAQGDGQWIRYDLGSSRTIHNVSIAWYKGNERASRFDVQVSPNGTTWTTALSALSSGTSLEPETYDFSDRAARFVRIVGHGTTLNTWNSITEVRIR